MNMKTDDPFAHRHLRSCQRRGPAADTGAQSNNGRPTLPRMPVRWRRMPVRTWRRTTWTIVRSTLALGQHGLDDDPDNMSSDEVHKNSM